MGFTGIADLIEAPFAAFPGIPLVCFKKMVTSDAFYNKWVHFADRNRSQNDRLAKRCDNARKHLKNQINGR